MNELKFIMLTKHFQKNSETISEFFELLTKWVEHKHSDDGMTASLNGISGIDYCSFDYTWERPGCYRGCCGYHSGSSSVNFNQLLNFIQGYNTNG